MCLLWTTLKTNLPEKCAKYKQKLCHKYILFTAYTHVMYSKKFLPIPLTLPSTGLS